MKSNKKWFKNQPKGRDKNRLGDSICRRVGGLATQVGTNVVRDAKKEHHGHPKGQKTIQDMKNTEKPNQKKPKRDPALRKGARNLREATKTQQNIITEQRAPRKHKTGQKKKREGTTNHNQPQPKRQYQ